MPETENPSVIQGGPETPPISAPAPTPNPAPVTEPPKAPLYMGLTGTIRTTDELIAYTKSLETKVLSQPAPVAAPVATTKETDPIEENWYSNPSKAVELIEKRVEERIDKREEKKAQQEAFWSDFYAKNADLKSLDRVVQSVVREKWASIEKMPVDQAKEFIAKESREIVSTVKRGIGVKETDLPSGGAVTLGASGQPAPTVPVATPGKPLSFAEQMNKIRTRGQKVA